MYARRHTQLKTQLLEINSLQRKFGVLEKGLRPSRSYRSMEEAGRAVDRVSPYWTTSLHGKDNTLRKNRSSGKGLLKVLI